jgi:phosphate-selective porin OprO/OprP
MGWQLGLFTDAVGDDFGDATKGFGRVVGRITGLLIYRHDSEHPESQSLLHLGMSGSALWAGEGSVRYRSRPESHLAPYLVDTGEVGADRTYVSGLEAAWVNGPLCIQGEFLHSWVQASDSIENFEGFYASASWFLTGESRPYDLNNGTLGRAIPKKNFNFRTGDWGAWEVATRFSFVDLNSGTVEGGRMAMLMAGVNWYLHSHIKWRFDYGLSKVTGSKPDGNLNLFQTRVELDF